MLRRRDLLWIGFAALLALPLALRFLLGSPVTPLDDSYEQLLGADGLYAALLGLLPSPVLPVLLGVVTFGLLLRATRRAGMARDVRLYTLLLFAITPVTITAFTTHGPAALIVPLGLAAYLLRPWLAAIPLLFALLADPWAGVILVVVFASQAFAEQRREEGLLYAATLLVLFVTEPVLSLERVPLFGEFGAPLGYSVFIFLLAAVFVVQHWRAVDASRVLTWALLFAASAYIPSLRPLVLLPLAVYAANALDGLLRREWRIGLLKQASVVLLICLGLFVLITHVQLLVDATPQRPLVSLVEEANEDPRSGAVFTTTEQDAAVEYYATRDVVAISPDDPLWTQVSITDAGPFLTRNDVRFLLLPPGEEDRGFLFLVTHNEKFINVAEDDGYTLWLVLQEFVPR